MPSSMKTFRSMIPGLSSTSMVRSLLENAVNKAQDSRGRNASESAIERMEKWGGHALAFWNKSAPELMQGWERQIEAQQLAQKQSHFAGKSTPEELVKRSAVHGWCAFACHSTAPLLSLNIKLQPYHQEKQSAQEVLGLLSKVPKESRVRVICTYNEGQYCHDLFQLSRSWVQADRRALWALCKNGVIDVAATLDSAPNWLLSWLTNGAQGRLGETRTTQWGLEWIKAGVAQNTEWFKLQIIEAVSKAEELWHWTVPIASSPARLIPSEAHFALLVRRAQDVLAAVSAVPSDRLRKALETLQEREQKIAAFEQEQQEKESARPQDVRRSPLSKTERSAREETLLTAMEVKDLGVVKWCLSEEGQMSGPGLLFFKSGRRGGLLDAVFRGANVEKSKQALVLLEAAGFDFLQEATLKKRAYANLFHRGVDLCITSRAAEMGETLALAQLRACRAASLSLDDVQGWQQQTASLKKQVLQTPKVERYWTALERAIERWDLDSLLFKTQEKKTEDSQHQSLQGEESTSMESPPAERRKRNRL